MLERDVLSQLQDLDRAPPDPVAWEGLMASFTRLDRPLAGVYALGHLLARGGGGPALEDRFFRLVRAAGIALGDPRFQPPGPIERVFLGRTGRLMGVKLEDRTLLLFEGWPMLYRGRTVLDPRTTWFAFSRDEAMLLTAEKHRGERPTAGVFRLEGRDPDGVTTRFERRIRFDAATAGLVVLDLAPDGRRALVRNTGSTIHEVALPDSAAEVAAGDLLRAARAVPPGEAPRPSPSAGPADRGLAEAKSLDGAIAARVARHGLELTRAGTPPLKVAPLETAPIVQVLQVPDGSALVLGRADGRAEVWSWETGARLASVAGLTSPLAMAADGREAYAARGNEVLAIELPSGRTRQVAELGGAAPTRVRLASDRTLALVETQGVEIRDLADGRVLGTLHSGSPAEFGFLHGNRLVFAVDRLGRNRDGDYVAGLRIVEAASGRSLRHEGWEEISELYPTAFPHPFREGLVTNLRSVGSDPKLFHVLAASYQDDRPLFPGPRHEAQDPRTGKLVSYHPKPLPGGDVAFDPAGAAIARRTPEGRLEVWSTASDELPPRLMEAGEPIGYRAFLGPGAREVAWIVHAHLRLATLRPVLA